MAGSVDRTYDLPGEVHEKSKKHEAASSDSARWKNVPPALFSWRASEQVNRQNTKVQVSRCYMAAYWASAPGGSFSGRRI